MSTTFVSAQSWPNKWNQGDVLKKTKSFHFFSQQMFGFYRCNKHLSFVWQHDHLALVRPRTEAAFDWFWHSFRRLMITTDWSQTHSAFNFLPIKINTKATNAINHQITSYFPSHESSSTFFSSQHLFCIFLNYYF